MVVSPLPGLDHDIKPLVNYRHKRVVCVELLAEPNPILLASLLRDNEVTVYTMCRLIINRPPAEYS